MECSFVDALQRYWFFNVPGVLCSSARHLPANRRFQSFVVGVVYNCLFDFLDLAASKSSFCIRVGPIYFAITVGGLVACVTVADTRKTKGSIDTACNL